MFKVYEGETAMNKLKQLREAAGLSQWQLAVKACISVRTLQKYEQNVSPVQGAAALTVYNLAKALRCRMEDIIEESPLK